MLTACCIMITPMFGSGDYDSVVQYIQKYTTCYGESRSTCSIFHPNGYVEITPGSNRKVCFDDYCSQKYIDKNFIKNYVDPPPTEGQMWMRSISPYYDDDLKLCNPSNPFCFGYSRDR